MSDSQKRNDGFGSVDTERFQKMREAGQRRNALIKQKKADKKNKRNGLPFLSKPCPDGRVLMSDSQRLDAVFQLIAKKAMERSAARRAAGGLVLEANMPDKMRDILEEETVECVVPVQEYEEMNEALSEKDQERTEKEEVEDSEDSEDDDLVEAEQNEIIASETMNYSLLEEEDETTDYILPESTSASEDEEYYEGMQEALTNLDMEAEKKREDAEYAEKRAKIIAQVAEIRESQKKNQESGSPENDRYNKMRESAERRYKAIRQKKLYKKIKENGLASLLPYLLRARSDENATNHAYPRAIRDSSQLAINQTASGSNPDIPDEIKRDLENMARETGIIVPRFDERYKKVVEEIRNRGLNDQVDIRH
ncbi:hypothetical protein GCK72_010972 [Caenorhabditis remanei]|uniref:Uncharacterized protein n=1 Tax=Caenorhabditis remanei TaxID=31234 RepID=A0A6A5H4C0_CAERE|nr:hypothetical protein GCK72_010972 [Caenorhabditis remanei]KAF1762710.1 hypothetical protein GCK72_010972 [Caenorhabditis remanei]